MSYTVPGLVMTDHELTVPLDHADPLGEQITLFAREVCEPEGRAKPYLVYRQGGPGFERAGPTAASRTGRRSACARRSSANRRSS